MPKTLVIDPVTRLEGHMKIEVKVDGGKVVEAKSSGTMFRGFEIILRGRDPRDAQQITQRICGVCPTSHGTASALSLDSAFGAMPPKNGLMLRNLIFGANYLQSHILHFYHLAALDFVKGPAAPPFIPTYEGDYRLDKKTNDELVAHYVKALDIRKKAHEMSAIFSGKMPHPASVITGGVTCVPTAEGMKRFSDYLTEIRSFIDNVYIPDVLAAAGAYSDYFSIGKGCGNMLAYGVFDMDADPDYSKRKRFIPMGLTEKGRLGDVDPMKITEDVKYSKFSSASGKYPGSGETVPAPEKPGAYTWLKAPRYDGKVFEVGPLARMIVAHVKGTMPAASKLIGEVLSKFSADETALYSVLGRHAARAIETKIVADEMVKWIEQVVPGESAYEPTTTPDVGSGMGLTEAPRGALGHWINIRDGVIENYQCVVPTTWNASPMDDNDQAGPIEQALIGCPVKDINNPIEPGRIVRSFDPCLACAIHTVNPKGDEISRFRIV
ncbi:MAG TPA: nickel-dependent hydrogenase large subunit [bacterium]|nr:nickel-dependent hydrogenase large subunit [bacterium]